MIEVAKLGHRIGKSQILRDISVTLPAGQITALIGPNGAGKSTLLNLIARQEPVQAGQIQIDGADLSTIAHRDLALRLAVVAQSVGVASRLRVRELVHFGRWPHHQGRAGPEDQARVARALEDFDLTDLAERFLDEISGGQRQRAFVAMADCQDTAWLLLDEPLNNLDLRHATRLMTHLDGLARTGKGVVIVVHDLNYALTWADHLVALADGAVAFAGPTREVARAAALSRLYDTEVRLDWTEDGPLVRHHGTKPAET